MTETNKGLVVPDGEEVLKEPTIATEEIPSGGLVVPEGEDELDSFIGVKSQSPKKETVTPIAEKKVEESVVAQNSQDALPLERRVPEEPGQSFQSVLPSPGIGSDSPLSVDKVDEEPLEDLSRYLGPSAFNTLQDEKKAINEELANTEAKKVDDPMGIKKGEDLYLQMQEALKPKLSTEKDIEATLKEIEEDVNISDQEKEAARTIALEGKKELLDHYESEKQRGLGLVLKGHVANIEKESGGDYNSYISKSKDDISKDVLVGKEIKEEYGYNKRISDETSKEAILGALATTTTPNNAYVKLAAINKSENKEEDLAAYKQDLLEQISKDNKLLGNRLTDTDLKRFAMRSIEEIAAISSSLAEKMNTVNGIQAEKQQFLAKKHKGVNEEIDDLSVKLIKEADSLTEAEKTTIKDLIDKKSRLKDAFFEEDGKKTGELMSENIKEGSEKYNLYKDIFKDIPEHLSSKEKFDVFYLALKEATMNSLLAADLIDAETGEYDPTIENVFRDFLGIESVLGVDFSGEIIGSLTPMEIDAMQMKGDLDDLTNIFLNNTAYSSPKYWDELMNSFAGGLIPNMTRASGKQSDTTKAGELSSTLSDFGITEGEGVNKKSLSAWNELIATPEKGVTWQKFAGTTGGSFAMMVHLMGGTAVLRAGKIGKLGKVITKAEKILNKTKAGKLLFSGLKAGANAEVSGRIFNDTEELEFKQFAVGEIGSKAFENLLKAGGLKYVPMFVKGLGLTPKAALDFALKISTRAAAEFTEESIQSIVGAYNSSDSLKGMAAELKKQFPDMDAVTEFAILTGLSGAIFGTTGAYNDVRKKLKEGGYSTKEADSIMDKVAEEYKKAAGTIDEGKGEEGHLTKVTDKKSPVKGGDTFTVVRSSADGREMLDESYQINKIDKDFNVHVTINGKEQVLTKEEFSKLRRNKSFELFRESKAPVKAEPTQTARETTTEPVAEVVGDVVVESEVEVDELVAPEVINDKYGDTEYTNKEGKFFSEEEVLDMTPEQLSEMTVKNPSEAVQAKVAPEAEVAGEAIETTPEVETGTKTEVKTDKETKAEVKKVKEAKRQEEAKKAESVNNELTRNVVSYNELSSTKKNQKKGKDLLSSIQKSSSYQGHTISQEGDNVVVSDSKGKKIKETNEFTTKGDPNEWVSQEVSSTDEAWAVGEVNDNRLDGDATSGRIHLAGLRSTGLTTKEIAAGVKQIKKGNTGSVSAKRVIAALADARKKGVYEMSDGKGGLTSVSVSEVSTRELTEEETLSEDELNAEMESKSEEQSQAQKIQDATESFTEAVRKLKYTPPGSFQSGGPLEIYNAAVEAMARIIYAGGSTAAAVSKAMAYMKASDWYKKKLPADRKKIKAEAEASFIKNAEEINDLAKIERAKVEGTAKEAREAKKKERKQKKKKIKDDLDEAHEALNDVRDELSGNTDPSSLKKLNMHIVTLLNSPNISEEVKKKLRVSDDKIRYNVIKNKWSQDQAIQLVKAFSEIEGGLELLLSDIEGDFLKYGQVGIWILDGVGLYYNSQGRTNDATDVGIRKVKIAEILGRSFQALGHVAPGNIMDAMVYTAFTETVQVEERVKQHRNDLIKLKREKGDVSSEEVFEDARGDLNETIGDISNHPQFEDAINKAVAEHVKKEKAAKKEAKEKADKKGSIGAKRAALKAERKQIKKDFKAGGKNIFYSSVIPMLTPEGIEYAGDIAKTYIESGMLKVSEIASALKEYFKKEHDADLSDSDILKILNNVDAEKGVKDNKKDSSKKLADKVIDHVSQKENKKTGDAVEVLIRNLFAKAKDSLPTQGEAESDLSYRDRLIKAMKGQDFAKEVWDGARNTVIDILNNKEAKGELTGGEKGKILKDLEGFFGDEVGMPFSKSLLEGSLKEQIKSDGEKISDIVKKHYSAVSKNGKSLDTTKEKARSLAEKIVADTGLSSAQADQLAASLEKQFSELIEPFAKKALAKVLGVEELPKKALDKVLKKNSSVVDNVMEAIRLGALDGKSFLDAFADRFGFAKISDVHAQKLNAFIYDISHLPAKSVARDKAFIEFRTYMKGLESGNEGALERWYHGVITSFFYQHILGSPSTVLRSVYGLLWGGGLQMLTEFIKSPRLFTKGLRSMMTSEKDLHGTTIQNFRVMGAIMKGIKNLGPEIIRDSWKEGYIPYESALEGAKEAHTTLGVLDKLSNAEWKDLSTIKKVAKLFETGPSKMLRLLMASDAVGHYSVRGAHVVTSTYNKILREGKYSSTKERGFWEELDKRTGNTDAARKTAETQAFEELEKLKAAGVSTKNFRDKQRIAEIIFESLDEDVKIQAEQKSMEMRLGHHPKGSFGFVYDKLSKFLSNVPFAMFVIPFLKIPLNLADAATDYIPLLGLKKAAFGRGNWMVGRNKSKRGSSYVSDDLIKKSQSGKEFIAENRIDYLIKQGIGAVVTGYVLQQVLSSFDLEDDDPDKRIEITYKGTNSFADNYILEKEKGLKQFHYRFKIPGTNKWSGWIDYRDSPLGPILAFAGGMSDKLKYDREDYNKVVTSDEMWDAAEVGAMNSLFFFKEQNFLQAIGDLFRVISTEKTAGVMGKKYLAQTIARSLKGVTYPSLYTAAYSWKKALFNDFKKANVDVKDSPWAMSYMADKLMSDVIFLDQMREDYKDNLGQKVRVPNKIPLVADDYLRSFQDVVGINRDKGDVWNHFLSSTHLHKDDVAPNVLQDREVVYESSGKEVSLKVKQAWKEVYDLKVLARYKEVFEGEDGKILMKELKKDKEKYKAFLRKQRFVVKKQMYYGEDSPWKKIRIN